MLIIGINSQDDVINEALQKHGEFNFPVSLRLRNLSPIQIVSTMSHPPIFLQTKGKAGDESEVIFDKAFLLRNFITDMQYIAKAHGFKEVIEINGLEEQSVAETAEKEQPAAEEAEEANAVKKTRNSKKNNG